MRRAANHGVFPSCIMPEEAWLAVPDQAQECDNLMRVVRELTESRSKLVAGKSVMAEKFAELQAEYLKARTPDA